MTNAERGIREAMAAGARALNSLRQAQSQLDSARNWGLVDIFGGGFLTTMLKHGKIDEARQYVRQAREDLLDFSRELRDVNLPDIEIGDFSVFADYVFDGMLADLMVQQKINRAREQIAQAIWQVEDLLRRLRGMSA